jgi:hypothetical protein
MPDGKPNIDRIANEGMRFTDSYGEFPPRRPPASFSIDQVAKKLEDFLASD